LKPGDTLEGIYLVRERNLRTTRNGSPYLQMELADRTGSARAMCWQISPKLAEEVVPDSFVRIRGRTELYQGNLQVIVEAISQADRGEVDVADFLNRSRFDNDELWTRFVEIVESVTDEDLRRLLDAFRADDSLVEKFRAAPAAMYHHHACVGGLLEHTVAVMELAVLIGERYEILDSELLLVGAVFHDIGKTEELSCDASFNYTDTGALLGHIAIGVRIIEKLAEGLENFPKKKLNLLMHMVLSHHGTGDFGSPITPKIPEAVALHLIDNIDAKMEGARAAFERSPAADRWTGWEKMFEGKLFKEATGLSRDG